MNTVISAAADSAQLGWLMGLMTAAFLVFFGGWTWWAYRPANRAYLEEAGRIPLMNDGEV